MKQYNVSGMSCTACQARVEKAVSAVPGVTSCSVSLLTNSMGVEGSAAEADIIRAVENAGYGASLKDASFAASDALEDKETPALKKRLFTSLGFLLVLMYFSMGHHMWGWPVPSVFEGFTACGILQMVLALIVMIINRRFFISGFKSVLHAAPNMDTLVALGSAASFVWSVYALAKGIDELYFESAAMILTLITVGKMLEARSKGKTTDALKSLMKLAPKTACVLRQAEDGSLKEETVPAEALRTDDIFIVRPGESIPADGIVIEGSSAVNEAALTGESLPADKEEGDSVSSATINLSGYLKCKATRVGNDTALAQIIKMMSDAAATKAPIAKIADKVSGVFVPVVIGIAVVTLAAWLILGKEVSFALARAISVLVISCPCALGLATPVAIMVGNGVGAKHGVLFKTAVSLEETGKVQIVVLDKTGTITKGEPSVTEIVPAEGIEKEELLSFAYALEKRSEHPLALAVVKKAEEEGIKELPGLSGFSALPGNGLSGTINGEIIRGGSLRYIAGCLENEISQDSLSECTKQAELLADAGSTPLLFSKGNRLFGIIAVADTVKDDSAEAVKDLEDMGIQIVMLTGDNERTAKAVAAKADIKNVVAGVLPQGKAAAVQRLKTLGKLAMVGDGINDAPALTSADIGIAIGAGTDVAIDAADVVLMNSRLSDVPAAIRLSRATLTNIHENLFWAFFYNVIGIPVAAGCFIAAFGLQLNPMIGAAAMSLSSFCVVSNALRLNLTDIYNKAKNRKGKPVEEIKLAALIEEVNKAAKAAAAESKDNTKEKKTMTKTLKIEGMMCPHCEARVKKTLEAIDGIENAVTSFEKGTAVLTMSADVDYEVMKSAVEAQDYKVLGIE